MTGSESSAEERRRLAAGRPRLAAAQRIRAAIRDHFFARDFLEVETPLRLAAPPPEVHIEAAPAGDHFLRTSPELHMKRLLAAGYERIFQMGPCFRANEFGRLHHPEFCMLEWYRAGADYRDILADTRALLTDVARSVLGATSVERQGRTVDLAAPWHEIDVASAFQRAAGWNPVAAFDADRFDVDMVERVEPSLPGDRPVALLDFPAAQAAMARLKPGRPEVAERWELYVGGVELANAYSELTDADEQRERFRAWRDQRRQAGKPLYPVDEAFLEALAAGMPAAGGIALGVDRLVMLLTDAASLDDVLPFR